MRTVRVIARLDIKGPNLVKGIRLEGLRVLGKPEEYALHYYRSGIDELIYMDVVASLYGRNNLLEIISRTAERIFIPLTVGGGIRTIEDIRAILRAGADKVAINTAALNRPELINEAASVFGSQCVVISLEAKIRPDGSYEAYTDNGRERTGRDCLAWAKEAARRGAGELLLTCVDREGTGSGYDTALLKAVAESVPIPVIACGGAGELGHFQEALEASKIDAVCAASLFHYRHVNDQHTGEYEQEGNIEFLKNRASAATAAPRRVNPLAVEQVKEFLRSQGYRCRQSTERAHPRAATTPAPRTAIVDYGLGNLFSIRRALQSLGVEAEITRDPRQIGKAQRLILPGVGAFGAGMRELKERGLIEPIKEFALCGKPLLGICLGMQLLMSDAEEFGSHQGLDLIPGSVRRLPEPPADTGNDKIPHIGWNTIDPAQGRDWAKTLLADIPAATFVYFVHSNAVIPRERADCLAVTRHGNGAFCSVVRRGSLCGCQFHPERSGEAGLRIYRHFLFEG